MQKKHQLQLVKQINSEKIQRGKEKEISYNTRVCQYNVPH